MKKSSKAHRLLFTALITAFVCIMGAGHCVYADAAATGAAFTSFTWNYDPHRDEIVFDLSPASAADKVVFYYTETGKDGKAVAGKSFKKVTLNVENGSKAYLTLNDSKKGLKVPANKDIYYFFTLEDVSKQKEKADRQYNVRVLANPYKKVEIKYNYNALNMENEYVVRRIALTPADRNAQIEQYQAPASLRIEEDTPEAYLAYNEAKNDWEHLFWQYEYYHPVLEEWINVVGGLEYFQINELREKGLSLCRAEIVDVKGVNIDTTHSTGEAEGFCYLMPHWTNENFFELIELEIESPYFMSVDWSDSVSDEDKIRIWSKGEAWKNVIKSGDEYYVVDNADNMFLSHTGQNAFDIQVTDSELFRTAETLNDGNWIRIFAYLKPEKLEFAFVGTNEEGEEFTDVVPYSSVIERYGIRVEITEEAEKSFRCLWDLCPGDNCEEDDELWERLYDFCCFSTDLNGMEGYVIDALIGNGSKKAMDVKIRKLGSAAEEDKAAVRTSKAFSARLKSAPKAPKVSFGSDNGMLNIKNGFDFRFLPTIFSQETEFEKSEWYTILPYNKAEGAVTTKSRSILPTRFVIPTKYDAKDASTARWYTNVKFSGLYLPDEIIDMEECYMVFPDEFRIEVRKSAGPDTPPSQSQIIVFKNMAAAPQMNVGEDGCYATGDSKGRIKVPTIMRGENDSFTGYEYTVVRKSDYIQTDPSKAIDMSTLTWTKIAAGKTIDPTKLSCRYSLVNADTKAAKEPIPEMNADYYLLLRRAGDKKKNLLPSRVRVTMITKSDDKFVWKPVEIYRL